MAEKLHSVSLFSNCGAGDVGYATAGFEFNVMAELSSRRLEVCLLNHPAAIGVVGDLRETWPQVVKTFQQQWPSERVSLLAACPPCQGLSSARNKRGNQYDPDAGMRDKRNLLVTVIANVAKSLLPRIIVVENVQAFLSRQVRHPTTKKSISAARLLIEELQDKYVVYPILADLCHFGVPQSRKRTFLTFIHRDEPANERLSETSKTPYPMQSHGPSTSRPLISISSALRKMSLPSLDARSPKRAISSVGGGLHSVPVWLDRRYDMVAAIPINSGKSAWGNSKCKQCKHTSDDSAAICSQCNLPLLKPILKTKNGRYRLVTGFKTSTYRRIHPNKPAMTITTASGHIGSNNTIHPNENRLLSPLECAVLQTIPRQFKWGDSLQKWGHTTVREMIGEAVPPLFTAKHGKVLSSLLRNDRPIRMSSADHKMSTSARMKLFPEVD